jgi:nucleotide-binding universal stress UspA family protein
MKKVKNNVPSMKGPSKTKTVPRRHKHTGPVATSNGAFRINTILVPIDLTAASRMAVTAGKALAAITGAKLVLVNVVSKVRDWKDFGYGAVDWPHDDEPALKRSRRKLEWLRCHTGEGCVFCSANVRSGDPAVEISRAALALKADLIVMATHHLADSATESGRSRSVAEEVLRRTQLPVLMLPIPARSHER